MNAYSLDGMIVIVLLFICLCAYMRRVKRLKEFFLTEKNGPMGSLYKASIIGTRLHWAVSLSCLAMSVYVLFLK
eukprot:m.246766 g.246766  ORF g.246766 m.246766 type:complete len:74 (+) comp26436_c0_seq1:330-551(+)